MGVQNHEGSSGGSSHQFMLRLWLEELGNERYELRGSVKHVNSGELRYFRDWSGLETFLEEPLRRNDSGGIQSGSDWESNRRLERNTGLNSRDEG